MNFEVPWDFTKSAFQLVHSIFRYHVIEFYIPWRLPIFILILNFKFTPLLITFFEIFCKQCRCCRCMISYFFSYVFSVDSSLLLADCFFNITFDYQKSDWDIFLLVQEFCSLFQTNCQFRKSSSCLHKRCLTVWRLMRFDTRVYFITEMILILVEIFLGISSLSCHHLPINSIGLIGPSDSSELCCWS